MTTTMKPATAAPPAAARRRPRKALRVVLTILGCALLVAGWMQLGPVGLGGRASYVVTDGTSMLPRFHTGGMVITRAEPAYHVGEVVAYHNKELKTVVMHRIVAIDGNRYVFKGDNNDFRDDYHPTKSELVGKEWVYWPNGGRYLMLVRQPIVFAVILAGLGFFAVSGFVGDKDERDRERNDPEAGSEVGPDA